ncbi:MAG: hypothetical protein M1830_005537 [Pleopsidium flavum]|nr:MAG: hypothetical protein M1830_005537 [Pleopsidium flavum]
MPDRLRLHISPFNPTLLATLFSPVVLPSVDHVSYHTLRTFPERSYGYVELPTMEAEKIKKKYHGSILKGAKVHIEEARKEKQQAKDEGTTADDGKTKSGKVRKSRREDGVLPGFELPDERQVQRGWTKPPSHTKPGKKSVDKNQNAHASLYTTKAECLFKATLPPNVASGTTSPPITITNTKSGNRKRKDSVEKKVVVHEFCNTLKHSSFLREDSGRKETRIVSEFIDGKGWVDEEGDLIEDVLKVKGNRRKIIAEQAAVDATENAQHSASNHTSTGDSERRPKRSIGTEIAEQSVNDSTSSTGTSSDSDLSEENHDNVRSARADENLADNTSSTLPPEDIVKDVHPLEAIFKRPKPKPSNVMPKPSLKVSTSFNFFDPDAEDDAPGPSVVPQTPFTRQDFQQRRQRSAAPTPDTAAPGKTFSRVWPEADEEPDYGPSADWDDADDAPFTTPLGEKNTGTPLDEAEAAEIPQSDFAKWFWEHRGETNRAWKKRRREAGKEKRHRENKRRGRSAI